MPSHLSPHHVAKQPSTSPQRSCISVFASAYAKPSRELSRAEPRIGPSRAEN
ncbi:hypothetical protein IC582_005582 [Cucumis melo]